MSCRDGQQTTHYAFCLYGGTSAATLELAIPPDALRWSAVRAGLRYADRGGDAAGVTRVALRRGREGRVRVVLRAGGPNLPPLRVDDVPVGPLMVQLVNSETGTCFASAYAAADVQRPRPGVLEAEIKP